MKCIQFLMTVAVLTASSAALAGEIRLSDIDTNDYQCSYAKQEVSLIAANEGRLPIREVCVNGPVFDPRGIQYAYQLQVFIPDTAVRGVAIPLGLINTNDVRCQKAEKELSLLNSSRVHLQFQCVDGPVRDQHSGQLYNYQLRTTLTVLR